MAQPLGPDRERFPDRLRTGGFTGVVREAKPGCRSLCIHFAEWLRRSDTLIAPETNADDRRILLPHARCQPKDSQRLRNGKMPHRVENPVERDAEVALAALACAFQARKDLLEKQRIGSIFLFTP